MNNDAGARAAKEVECRADDGGAGARAPLGMVVGAAILLRGEGKAGITGARSTERPRALRCDVPVAVELLLFYETKERRGSDSGRQPSTAAAQRSLG